jgi:hypothetical protein
MVDRLVDYLNGLCSLDPETVDALIEQRVDCTEALASHEHLVAVESSEGDLQVGMLGVLNGFVKQLTGGKTVIGANYETRCGCTVCLGRAGQPCSSCGRIVKLGKLLGFTLHDRPEGPKNE